MGTELQRRGLPDKVSSAAWNVERPQSVLEVHSAYVAAGAEVLLSNTLTALSAPTAMAAAAQVRAGVQLARQAIGERGFVLADFGPAGALSSEVAGSLESACSDADAALIETISTPDEAAAIVCAVRAKPLLVSFTFLRLKEELRTFLGLSPADCAAWAQSKGVAALGVNCGKDILIADMREILLAYRSVTSLPLFARPNAGTPVRAASGYVYPHCPDAMAEQLPLLLEAGVAMVGGCCGTTPEHIARFREKLNPCLRG
ncbi:MAG: homocysteine S-methyltransferase family protein [Gemmataceae bacterium]|nr:homocysteine S-methyltransferase family protein [Gemmataceae bacterium]MCI0741634.1 homocysteine S-methyltransferase family protein [Gemmataceae bacterium]